MTNFEQTLLTGDELLASQRVESSHFTAAIAVIATKSGTCKVTEVNIDGPTTAYVRFEDATDAVPTMSALVNQVVMMLAGAARVEEERLNRFADPRTMQRALMLCRRIAENNDPSQESLPSRSMAYLQQCMAESRRLVKQFKPSIDKVAEQLRQHGTVTGDTLREMLSSESVAA
ncbi:MAG TPA: hypothetical protein V6C97_33705 [Oculatellaceae cyanobacterium]